MAHIDLTPKQEKRIQSGINMIVMMMQGMDMKSYPEFESAAVEIRKDREGSKTHTRIATFNAFYLGYTGPDAPLSDHMHKDSSFVRMIMLGVQAHFYGWDRDDMFEHREVIFKEAAEAIEEATEARL